MSDLSEDLKWPLLTFIAIVICVALTDYIKLLSKAETDKIAIEAGLEQTIQDGKIIWALPKGK